ncbi:MAG: hypothetical protein KGL39_57810, partial [Patescibacteria group bacterium]|nr:hypothetical protein [Patescibacteria group bacterium]
MRRYANIRETIPQPCRIFGTVLRPFCLGHHLLFARLGLPFHGNPLADSSPGDFFSAVCVCAASYEETLNALLGGEWNGVYARWLARINKLRRGPLLFGREKHLVNSAKEYEAAKKVFSEHLFDAYRTPPVWRSDRSGAIRFTAPWEETFKCRLISAGFSESEVLN